LRHLVGPDTLRRRICHPALNMNWGRRLRGVGPGSTIVDVYLQL